VHSVLALFMVQVGAKMVPVVSTVHVGSKELTAG
jgi:hypothetical protein